MAIDLLQIVLKIWTQCQDYHLQISVKTVRIHQTFPTKSL